MWGKLYGELIIIGVFEYSYVVNRRPQDKLDINSYLEERSRSDLINETAE